MTQSFSGKIRVKSSETGSSHRPFKRISRVGWSLLGLQTKEENVKIIFGVRISVSGFRVSGPGRRDSGLGLRGGFGIEFREGLRGRIDKLSGHVNWVSVDARAHAN